MRSRSSSASSATSSSPRTRCRTRSRPRSSAGRVTATPRNPGAWIVATARNRAIDRIRRERTLARKTELLARLESLRADEEDDVSSIPGRTAQPRLHLLPSRARDRRRRSRSRCARSAGCRRTRSRARSSSPRRRSRSGSFARSGRSATPEFRSASRPTTCCPSGCAPCSPCSTSSSTRATPPRPATRSCGASSATRRSGSRKLLAVLMPDEAEALGLLALMLLQDSRREARTDAGRRARPARGSGPLALGPRRGSPKDSRVLERALALRAPGPYQLQAAIAALHARARPRPTGRRSPRSTPSSRVRRRRRSSS